MRLVILLNAISEAAGPDERDVLQQCRFVEDGLGMLGHQTCNVFCNLDLDRLQDELRRIQPDLVFNLVESFAGTDQLMPLATLLLESMHIPFTGTASYGLISIASKLRTKQQLRLAGLPTPAWLTSASETWQGDSLKDSARQESDKLSSPQPVPATRPPLAIVKAVGEHASLGMDDSAVVDCAVCPDQKLRSLLNERQTLTGKPHFGEHFIDGREFNLSLLSGDHGPQPLPPAEIRFVDFPPEKPRIVGYAAKWDSHAVEYHNTVRSFTFPDEDQPLLELLKCLAVRCWSLFELSGYARVDFRVDSDGRPWILEINANPCLSPDAGFTAAALQAGLSCQQLLQRILDDALKRSDLS